MSAGRLAVDKSALDRLVEGALELGVTLPRGVPEQLLRLRDELLRWNQKVNLTAITDPEEVLEKHFLDSLALGPDVPEGAAVLDVGSGAGFPGLPLALARPDLQVTMVDSVAKKVGFIKHAVAMLGLAPRTKGLHARLAGHPDREGLGTFDVAVARALADLPTWLTLARPYLAPGGRVLAMLAEPRSNQSLEDLAQATGLGLLASRTFQLPLSAARRTVVVFR